MMTVTKLLAVIVFGSIVDCSAVSDSSSFWTTTELMSVEWKKGCLTTAYCAKPQFRITASNRESGESNSITWIVTENIVADEARPFVSYWIKGLPSDLSVACEVIGSDPKYGFQRTCDYTPSVGIFRTNAEADTSYVGTKIRMSSQSLDVTTGKMVIELKGKCFNATITVQKHLERCPWCIDMTTTTVMTTTPKSDKPRQAAVAHVVFDERLQVICVTVLSTICVLSAAAFACLLVAYLRQRSNVESRENERTYLANLMKVDSPFGRSLKTEFDSPWEQKRKFVHWTSSSSNETVSTRAASSNDSSPKANKSSDSVIQVDEDQHPSPS